MEGSRLLPNHGKKRHRDEDDTESGFITSQKRINLDQSQPHYYSHAFPANSHPMQSIWRPLSSVDGTAAGEEALAKFGVYRDLEPSDAHDSSDDGSDDGRPFGGRTSTHIQKIRAYSQTNAHIQPHARHQADSNLARKQHSHTSAPPQLHVSNLSVFNHAGASHVVEPDASNFVHKPFQEPQSARLFNPVTNSRTKTMGGPNMGRHDDPHQMGGFPMRRSQAPSPSPAIEVNAIRVAPPAQQKQMLGEVLYRKIRKQQPGVAGKITDAILEMDNADILDLIVNDAALRNRVEEVMRVYKHRPKSKQKQKEMLGELLYPKIREQQPELAGKITGMLLEIDNAELLDLTTNDAALRSKVNEAMWIYENYLNSLDNEDAGPGSNGSVNSSESVPASRKPKYRKPRHRSLDNRAPPPSKELPLNKEPPSNEEPSPEPHVSTLPVVDYGKVVAVFQPGSSDPLFRPYQGLQPGEHLEQVEMCPRIENMDVEGGKLYLAQTLHFHYRLQIGCSLHGTEEGVPGYYRHISGKKQASKPQSRIWRCGSQSDHYLTNTEYIELAKTHLPHKAFVNVAEELIRQLRSKQCQPRRRNDTAQADDFDFHGIVPYVVM